MALGVPILKHFRVPRNLQCLHAMQFLMMSAGLSVSSAKCRQHRFCSACSAAQAGQSLLNDVQFPQGQ